MQNDSDRLVIRGMQKEDVAAMHQWVVAEGWQPGDSDLATFLEALPESFWVGELDGQIVAMISLVSYAGKFGFLGYYIVRPDKRGNGFGIKMWRHAMQRAENVVAVGLDGVTLQVPRYEKSGFACAHTNHRFQFKTPPPPMPPKEAVCYRELTADDVEGFLRLDACMSPSEESRGKVLRLWIQQPGAKAVVAVEGSEVVGVAVARPSGRSLRLSPIYASNPADASNMISALLPPELQDRSCFIDIPAPNTQGLAWAREVGLEEVGQTARMYRGAAPAAFDYTQVYSILSLEVG